jgi:hypothetical protein
VPDAVVDGWLRPLRTDPAIRRDFRHCGTHVRRDELLEAARGLRGVDRPALVVWATEDLMMLAPTAGVWPNSSRRGGWWRSRTPGR